MDDEKQEEIGEELEENDSPKQEELRVDTSDDTQSSIIQKATEAKEIIDKAKKIKMVAAALSAMSPLFLILLKIMLVFAIALLILTTILSFVDRIYIGMDKTYNFLKYGTAMESEDLFVEKLRAEYRKYHTFSNVEEEFDLPLIMATVNYARVIEPEGLNIEHIDTSISPKDTWQMLIPDNNVRFFYHVMHDELGEIYTFNPFERKLLAHMVGFRVDKKCVKKPKLGAGFFNDVSELGFEVANSLEDITKLLETVKLEMTAHDETLNKIISYTPFLKNIINKYGPAYTFLIDMMGAQDASVGTKFWERKIEGWAASLDKQNPAAFISRIHEASQESEVVCSDDEFAVPVLVVFMDYELYKQYLIDYFIPLFYIDCKNCPYRGLEEDDPFRQLVITRMANEIFTMRDLYREFIPKNITASGDMFIGMGAFILDPQKCSPAQTLETILDSPCFSSSYGPRGSFWTPGGMTGFFHQGIDFTQAEGSPIFAMASGKVVANGYGFVSGYGWHVYIDHGEIEGKHFLTRYAHMVKQSDLKVNDIVHGGDLIGYVGKTGRSTGDHLHFEIHVDGRHTDPIPYLRDILSGTSQFNNGGNIQHYLMSDHANVPYCELPDTLETNGQLPTSYAMIAHSLVQKTEPREVAEFICEKMPDNRQSIINSTLASQKFEIYSEKIPPGLQSISQALDAGGQILVHVNGGPFDQNKKGNYLAIVKYANGRYLVLDPTSEFRTQPQGYLGNDVSTRILNFIVSDDIWAFTSSSAGIGNPGGTLTAFNDKGWANHLAAEVKKSKLGSLKPKDANQFFQRGVVTNDGWGKILTAMSYLESSHQPGLTYDEGPKIMDRTTGKPALSTGLFQMSQGSIRGYKFPGYEKVTTNDLKDPYKNISIAVQLLEHWVEKDGCISCKAANSWRGGARYWAVLRDGKVETIRAAVLKK